MSVTIPQIPDVATFVLDVDIFEMSRSGTSNQISWGAITNSAIFWGGPQTFNSVIFITSQSQNTATILGIGQGDMSIAYRGEQGGPEDTRTGMQIAAPAALADGSGIQELVMWGKWAGTNTNTPYTRMDQGWGSSGPGFFAIAHQESGVVPDLIPAPGGFNCAPMTFGMADHTASLSCYHILGGTDGYLQSSQLGLMNPVRTFNISAMFIGVSNFIESGVNSGQIYDGKDMAYLLPPVPVAAGHHDSHCLVWSGQWHTGSSAHWVDWKWQVNVTDNSGTNTYKLQTRTDNNSFATVLTISPTGTLTLADGSNVVAGTGTGTQIATATGQKLGFWGHTPVVQQVLATGAGHTVDDVITLLQTLGMCKQS